MRHALSVLALLVTAASAPARAQATISDGTIVVEVNELGVLAGTFPTPLCTLDGRRADLRWGTAEWFGVAYDGALGHVEYAANGSQPDWTARLAIMPLEFEATGREVRSLTRAGELEVTTHVHFDPEQHVVLVTAELRNVGVQTLSNIYYTREWTHPEESWTFPDDMMVQLSLEPGIVRRAWMFGDLRPGDSVGVGFSYQRAQDPGPSSLALGSDVPLSLWTSLTWPTGLVVGETSGISFGDYDADGWPDLFALQGGNLFRNVEGQDWELVANLQELLPFAQRRYGSSFGDYDNDGHPDIGCEPRAFPGDTCFHLLRNLGQNAEFEDVATDPSIIDVQACNAHAEGICWGDVDGDGNMDMFLPVYPSFHFGGPGNFFYYNLGPVGPEGAYAFREEVDAAGLDNPPFTSRPEGAQFVDVDFDGDFDLFCNGTVYRNTSTPGTAQFDTVTSNAGIQFSNQLEEGITFMDKDLDGDFDLVVVYTLGSLGVRVYEAKGDGTYQMQPTSTVDSFQIGLDLGVSAADWDNDGDMDLTTRQVFRRNQFVETGEAHFTVATHTIPSSHLTSATPAWADWDRDGDLDCGLGDWLDVGNFYENTLYDAATPDADRRYLRVRVMRDSTTVPRGLEHEYGASVEVHVAGEEHSVRRRKFVSSSGGYLTQDEYPLHFGLPADPTPGDPANDLVVDVSVDLAGPPKEGYLRIDKHVNPALGGIQLAELQDREIVVYRSGAVSIDGCRLEPFPARPIRLTTTTDGLVRPTPSSGVPALVPLASEHYIGIEFDTFGSPNPVRVTELILDGHLDAATGCGSEDGTFDVWDISVPGAPTRVPNARLDAVSRATNDRSYYRTNIVLAPERTYRLVAAVVSTRSTTIAAPVATGAISVNGGLSFTDPEPCTGANVEAALLDPTAVAIALRFREQAGDAFTDLGLGLAGAAGVPHLVGTGTLQAGASCVLDLRGAAPNAPALLAVGGSPDCRSAFGGVIVPALDSLLPGLTTSAAGTLTLSNTWSPEIPPGASFYYQVAVLDPTAPAGVAFSNAIAGSSQP